MNSMKKFFFKIALLLMGVSFSTAYGDEVCGDEVCRNDDYNCCGYYRTNPKPLGTGFMIGVYGTFQTVYFNTRDKYTEPSDADRPLWRYDSIQKAPGGGGFISYGYGFCDRFVAAIRFDALGLGESAHHNYRDGVEDSLTQDINLREMGLRWAVDLSFQPGILIGNCLLTYFKVGGTLGSVREKVSIKDDAPPFDILDRSTKNHLPGGYVLGAGADIALTNCFNFFVEYNWRSYTSHLSSQTTVSTVDDADFSVDSRITTLHSSAFTFGVAMQF